MLSPKEQRRYQRHIMLPEIGSEGQEKLKKASVLVVGAGGLGCPALQYLTAAGIGTIGIVDYDKVDDSNLQRQVLYGTYDVGKLKSIIAKNQLSRQNEKVTIKVRNIKIDHENALQILQDYDIIMDATDNYPARYTLSDACVLLDKPLVHGSVYRFEGQLSVFNYQGGPTYRCLYPTPPSRIEAPAASQTGVMGVLPGIIGNYMANEIIKIIVGKGTLVSGYLLVMDIFNNRFHHLEIPVNPENKSITGLQEIPV